MGPGSYNWRPVRDWGPRSSPEKERNQDGKTREADEYVTVGRFLSIYILMSAQVKESAKFPVKKETEHEKLFNSSILKREFKISGTIGEPGQTGKLSFVSLTHQIDSGIEREYKETNTVDAVIRSIAPHSSLRSYVETLPDLNLGKLRKILRIHFREKTAFELYQNLSIICQKPKESPQQFLSRALDLRNKVLFASQESDSQFDYGSQFRTRTF